LSTLLTVRGLKEEDIHADILTCKILDGSDRLISSENFIYSLPEVHNKFAYSNQFDRFILNSRYDIYHAQGIWSYPTYITAKIARKQNKPYLITPRGMLYPQDMARGKLKKHLFLKLFLLNDLQKAACIHATCIEEMEHLRILGIKSPVVVIPNPTDISDMEKRIVTSKDKLRVGYLGRIHPRKNVERLIYAWNYLQYCVENGELLIIGDGDKKYFHFLRQEARRLNLTNVVFTGFLSGNEKEAALSSLSYLVVPSDFENFGNIVTEALVRGIPVITSKGTPWRELNTHHCGWWIDNDIASIIRTLKEAISLDASAYQQMGLRGQALIKNNYSTEIVAEKMIQLYQWILHQGVKPDFVYD
jgi:glycosyltransferase involved in cell wall biosynthesis